LSTLPHQPISDNPCDCRRCSDADAAELAAHLGLSDPADDPAAIEADARAAEAVNWGGWEPILKRPTDADDPGEPAGAWGPDPEDAAWAAQFNEEGCAEDDLSPFEEWMEAFTEPSFERACRLHAELMEEEEQEFLYNDLVSRLGGFSADY
jgi:hypothetical protein